MAGSRSRPRAGQVLTLRRVGAGTQLGSGAAAGREGGFYIDCKSDSVRGNDDPNLIVLLH